MINSQNRWQQFTTIKNTTISFHCIGLCLLPKIIEYLVILYVAYTFYVLFNKKENAF